MILKMMLDCDDFEDSAGFSCFSCFCSSWMILKMMLDFDDSEDDAGF